MIGHTPVSYASLVEAQLRVAAMPHVPIRVMQDHGTLIALGRRSLQVDHEQNRQRQYQTNMQAVIEQLRAPMPYMLLSKIFDPSTQNFAYSDFDPCNIVHRHELAVLSEVFGGRDNQNSIGAEFDRLRIDDSCVVAEPEKGQIRLWKTQRIDSKNRSQCFGLVEVEWANDFSIKTEVAECDPKLIMGKAFSEMLEDFHRGAGQTLAAGDQWASIGRYEVSGNAVLQTVGAFLAHHVKVYGLMPALSEDLSLQSLADLFSQRQVRTIIEGQSYYFSDSGLGFLVSQISPGRVSVEFSIHPATLARDNDRWFASSVVAEELAAVFGISGVFASFPIYKVFLGEQRGAFDNRFGNGYAVLSREVCSLICTNASRELSEINQLEGGYRQALERALERCKVAAKHPASTQLISLLAGVLSDRRARPNIPTFVCQHKSHQASCDDVEGYFCMAIEGGRFSKDELFIHKQAGKPTSLTRVPIFVNGVVLPVGTLCEVTFHDDQIVSVAPIRLTMFSLPLDQAVEVYRHHYLKMYQIVGCRDHAVEAVYRELESAPELWKPTTLGGLIFRLLSSK